MKYAIFEIAGESFGIGIDRVVEILKYQDLHRIPELPDFVSGVINVRGEVVPVIDMRLRFGIAEEARRHRIILVRMEGDKVGLVVDDVTDIVEIPEDGISSPPKLFKGFRAEFMKGLCQGRSDSGTGPAGNGKVIIILDMERILTSSEKIMLSTSRKKLITHGRRRVSRRVQEGQE
ncbi:MAG: purine-binding chemotaxis protein CheW [Nitrospirae bacterium]|nr:purine-binding chemotaxis protein CheW [Nitrospirota bacterium]